MRLFHGSRLPFLLPLLLVATSCCVRVRAWFPPRQAILDSDRSCSKRQCKRRPSPQQLLERIQDPRGGGDGTEESLLDKADSLADSQKVDETVVNTAADATAVLAADMCAFF